MASRGYRVSLSDLESAPADSLLLLDDGRMEKFLACASAFANGQVAQGRPALLLVLQPGRRGGGLAAVFLVYPDRNAPGQPSRAGHRA